MDWLLVVEIFWTEKSHFWELFVLKNRIIGFWIRFWSINWFFNRLYFRNSIRLDLLFGVSWYEPDEVFEVLKLEFLTTGVFRVSKLSWLIKKIELKAIKTKKRRANKIRPNLFRLWKLSLCKTFFRKYLFELQKVTQNPPYPILFFPFYLNSWSVPYLKECYFF